MHFTFLPHESRGPGEVSGHSRTPQRVYMGMLFQTLMCYDDVIHLGEFSLFELVKRTEIPRQHLIQVPAFLLDQRVCFT